MSVYQIGIFAESDPDAATQLRTSIQAMLNDVGIVADSLRFFSHLDAKDIDRKSPFVGLYINLSRHNPTLSVAETALISDGKLIIPIYPKSNFGLFAPDELNDINGMSIEPYLPDWTPVAALTLESLDLLRKTRRIFISYKRDESSGVAIQLYEALDAAGFDVFLDTHSIRPGEVFQETLWHRMSDSDLVVLLDTPGFQKSRWTRAELARANVSNVQVVQLLWPNQDQSADAALSHPFLLEVLDFHDHSQTLGQTSRLQAATVAKLISRIEGVRARALGARYAHLVQEFHEIAQRRGLNPKVQRLRFITFEKDGRSFAVVPAIGVPDSLRYEDTEKLLEDSGNHTKVALLYDERGVRKSWLRHLEWLNRHPAVVKSVQVPKSLEWLKGI